MRFRGIGFGSHGALRELLGKNRNRGGKDTTKSLILILILLTAESSISYGIDADTAVVRSRELHVFAKKPADGAVPTFKAKTVLSRSQIRNFSENDISNALQTVPGVYIKSYGGLGGLKTVSVRGTTSQQTLVMIDGMRINSAQSGMTDLGAISPAITDRIEVARGGASAIFGGNAIGGAINIRTSEITADAYRFGSSIGAFGERTASAEMERNFGTSGLLATVDYRHSDGDYSFSIDNFGIEETHRRQNSVYDNYTAFVKYATNLWGGRLATTLLSGASDRGVPGAVVQGHIENTTARMQDKEITSISKWNGNLGIAELACGAVFKIGNSKYKSKEGFGLASDFTNRQAQLHTSASFAWNDILIRLIAEGEFADLRGNMLQKTAGDHVKRQLFTPAASLKYSARLVGGFSASAEGSCRLSAYSDNSPEWSPMAGFVLTHSSIPAMLRAEYSSNFRPPSFNEMYYLNYGTSGLRPEKSQTYNLGLACELFNGLFAEADIYRIESKDQIVSVQKSIMLTSAKNLDNTVTRGAEISVRCNVADSIATIALSYTRQEALDKSNGSDTYGKQLVYCPEEIISASLTGGYGIWAYGVQAFHASHRFATGDNDYYSMLPAYTLADAFVAVKQKLFGMQIQFKFEINNVFNENYSVILNYPMPLRSWRLGIRADFE